MSMARARPPLHVEISWCHTETGAFHMERGSHRPWKPWKPQAREARGRLQNACWYDSLASLSEETVRALWYGCCNHTRAGTRWPRPASLCCVVRACIRKPPWGSAQRVRDQVELWLLCMVAGERGSTSSQCPCRGSGTALARPAGRSGVYQLRSEEPSFRGALLIQQAVLCSLGHVQLKTTRGARGYVSLSKPFHRVT